MSVSREIFSERTIRWDLTSGAALSNEVGERKGGSSVSPDGRMLVTVTFDGEMQLSDFETGKLLASTQGPRGEVRGISFSPDGSSIATTEGGTAPSPLGRARRRCRILASGVYLYRLVIPSGTQTRKLTLLR